MIPSSICTIELIKMWKASKGFRVKQMKHQWGKICERKEFPIIKFQSVSLGYEKGQRMLITNRLVNKLQAGYFLQVPERN